MYIDANIFIFALDANTKTGDWAREILEQVIRGKHAITSSLAIDEVMWYLIKNNQKNNLKQYIQEIYSIRNLEVKETPALAPLQATTYIQEYNLEPRDAIHLACMKEFKQSTIISNDKDFDKVKHITRIGKE